MLKQCRYVFSAISMVIISLFFTGCWDYKDIENRGYVLGVAIDHTTSQPKGEFDLEKSIGADGERKYRVTFEMPKFVKAEQSKEQQKGGQHLLWMAEGESMFAITRSIGQKVYFAPFFEDIQSIILSESVAREGIGDILDFWLRDAEMRRRLYVFVTPGRAEDILKVKMQVEEPNSIFINKLIRNTDKAPYFASKAEIGQISNSIRNKASFFAPIVVTDGSDVKLEKAAVFNKEQKMVGVLDEFEVIGAKLLRKNLKEGGFVVPNPANPQKIVVFELYEANVKVTPHLEEDKLWFEIKARLVGNLGENTETKQDTLDTAFITAVEQAVAEELTRHVRNAYQKQQQLKADFCELGGLVYRKYPKYWEKIKNRWDDEIFPDVPLEIDIKVTIRRPVLMR